MRSLHHHLSADATQAEVESLIADLNADDDVDGILLQLPLPKARNLDQKNVTLSWDFFLLF